jgi:hypothetical protein
MGSSQSQTQLVHDTLFPAVKWSELEVERSSLSNVEVNVSLFYDAFSIYII